MGLAAWEVLVELSSEAMAGMAVLANLSSEVSVELAGLDERLVQVTRAEIHHRDHQTLEMLGMCSL